MSDCNEIAGQKVTMEELNSIGARIKYAADKSGIKQKIIAEKMEISENSLTAYIGGRRNIPKDKLIKFAGITGFSVTWLESGVGKFQEEPVLYNVYSAKEKTTEVPDTMKEYLQELLDTGRLNELVRITAILIKSQELEEKNAELEKKLLELQTEKGLN